MRRRVVVAVLRVASGLRVVAMWILPLRVRAVKAILRSEDGRVLLCRHSYGPGDWMLPGGLVRRSESLVDGVRREIAEELGISVASAEWSLLGVFDDRIGLTRQRLGLLTATVPVGGLSPNHEIAEARFFDPSRAPPDTSPATSRRLRELEGGGSFEGRW